MTVTTHESKWRMLVGAAPILGVAFLLWAAVQGDADVAASPTVRGILAGVAALGAIVAWWTARQLRVPPALPVAQAIALAKSGQLARAVTLSGRAAPLPGASPLVSPDGELCLWFERAEQVVDRNDTSDSARPFLLVDDSGPCIVLPAGADITGCSRPKTGKAVHRLSGRVDDDSGNDPQAGERLLREGDRIRVVGRFVPLSPEAMALQARATSPVARSELPPTALRTGDSTPAEARRAALASPPRGGASAAAPAVALPVVAAPGGAQPLVISIGSGDGEGGLYGVLAIADGLVMIVAGALCAWALVVQQ